MFRKIALFVLVLIISAFGQETATTASSGSKALLFSFFENSTLASGANQGGVGIKYFITPQVGLRVSIQLARLSETTPADPGLDGTNSLTGLELATALEYHMNFKRVSPFIGGGIGFATISTEMKPVVRGTGTLYQYTYKNRSGSGAGTQMSVFALMGVEFFVTNGVSIATEYRLGYTSLSESDEEITYSAPGSTSVTNKGGSSNSIGLGSTGSLTLTVYF